MNRQIKFRGKSKTTGEWVYGDLHLISKVPHIHINYGYRVIIDVDTIGQFTGLLDANKKEIYEGDIVKFRVLDDTIGEVWKEYTCEVSFCNGCFCTYGTPLIRGKWNGRDTVAVEICGNIHDNPESLK